MLKQTEKLTRNDIFEKVVKVLTAVLKSKQNRGAVVTINISGSTNIFKDLGLDSLESLDFLNGLEEEFGVNPDQYEANNKTKVTEIVDYVSKLLEKENRFATTLRQ